MMGSGRWDFPVGRAPPGAVEGRGGIPLIPGGGGRGEGGENSITKCVSHL